MANAWEMAKGLAEKHASTGGIFVRLASNGEKVTGVFCGEPFAREVVWTGERYEAFDPKNAAHQADGKRPSLRVAMNFFVIADGAMKVIEGGTQWFKDVLKVRDKYGLDKWSFEIERRGDAGDVRGPGARGAGAGVHAGADHADGRPLAPGARSPGGNPPRGDGQRSGRGQRARSSHGDAVARVDRPAREVARIVRQR